MRSTTAACRLRNSLEDRLLRKGDLRAAACAAASINWLVTPLMAETTITRSLSREASRMMSTTFLMADASPTDVPPNFMMRSGFFMEFENCLLMWRFTSVPNRAPRRAASLEQLRAGTIEPQKKPVSGQTASTMRSVSDNC